MSILFYIIASTFLISLISFIGVLFLFLGGKILDRVLLVLVALSAGALVGGAFLHLIPESIARVGPGEAGILKIFLFLLFGFCSFFILEQFIRWHHHHTSSHPEAMPFSYLILFSDSIHNFIDGLIIAASFIAGSSVGMVTVLAVILHEIPQEIGDYGALVYGGLGKTKSLFFNFLTALTAIFGGIIGFFLWERIEGSVVFLIPFAAGTFIYIACSDLIPEIKQKVSFKGSVIHFFVFLSGITLMFLLKLING